MSLSVVILGTAAAVPGRNRDNTALLIRARGAPILVDCPGQAVQRVLTAGVPPWAIRTVILTHDHVDHISGLASFIFVRRGHRDPLSLIGPAQCLDTVRKMLDPLGVLDGRKYPSCRFMPVPLREEEVLVRTGGLLIHSTPAEHSRDTISIRVRAGSGSFAYSSDTRKCGRVATLSEGCTALFHDCFRLRSRMGAARSNHSSAADAGEIAGAAGVRRLYLVHLDTGAPIDARALVREAKRYFDGRVFVPRDLQTVTL